MIALLRNGDYCPDGMVGFRQAGAGRKSWSGCSSNSPPGGEAFRCCPRWAAGSISWAGRSRRPGGTVGAGYAAEALADVPDLQVTGATWDEGGQRLHVELEWKGAPLTAEVPL